MNKAMLIFMSLKYFLCDLCAFAVNDFLNNLEKYHE